MHIACLHYSRSHTPHRPATNQHSARCNLQVAEAAPAGWAASGTPLRLLQIYGCSCYGTLPPNTQLDTLRDDYWKLRVEPVPADDAAALAAAAGGEGEPPAAAAATQFSADAHAAQGNGMEAEGNNVESQASCGGAGAHQMYVTHTALDGSGKVVDFKEPLVVVVQADETLDSVQQRCAVCVCLHTCHAFCPSDGGCAGQSDARQRTAALHSSCADPLRSTFAS